MSELPVRLIATDMDGTLLDDSGTIPEDNLRAIRAAQEAGIVFAIATGRFPENAYLKLLDCGVSCPIMGENGAHLVDEHLRPLAMHALETEAARQTLEILLSSGADCFIFGHRSICTTRLDDRHHSELSQGDRIRALGISYYHGPDAAREIVQGPVHKLYVCGNVPLEPIRQALEGVKGISVTRSGDDNLEVMPQGIDKGSGLREFAGYLGIPMAQVMALGDHDNDVPMLRAAGYGVAMGNASPEAKAAARFVTDDYRAFGFARAVERLALKH